MGEIPGSLLIGRCMATGILGDTVGKPLRSVIKNSAVDDGERENIAHMAFHLLHLGTDTGEYSPTFFLGPIE